MRLLGLALAFLLAACVLPVPGTAGADTLLTVKGRIDLPPGSQGGVRFDRKALEALPQHQITTSTPWTDGVSTFEGPLLCDLLARLGADGSILQARALNDYVIDIPMEDCERYPIILALERDGEPLSRRDKGPLWIVYPRDDFPELQLETINARWVWQLVELDVR